MCFFVHFLLTASTGARLTRSVSMFFVLAMHVSIGHLQAAPLVKHCHGSTLNYPKLHFLNQRCRFCASQGKCFFRVLSTLMNILLDAMKAIRWRSATVLSRVQ